MRASVALAALALVPAAPARAAPANVVAADFLYKPYRVEVNPGESVSWLVDPNGSPHTVTSERGTPEAFDSGDLNPGQRFSRAFTKPGRYTYICTIHPGLMRGVVQVGADTVEPKLSRTSVQVGKRTVRVAFAVSEEVVVRAVLTRANRVVKRVKTKQLREGNRSLSIKRPRRAGRYKVKLTPTDLEGNAGKAAVKRFAVKPATRRPRP